MSKFECLRCHHHGNNPAFCIECNAECVIRVDSEVDDAKPGQTTGPRPQGLSLQHKQEFVPVDGPLGAVLGAKVPVSGLIFVTGPAGAGKSTLVANLAIQLERAGRRLFVLDAEMDDNTANNVWRRGGATKSERARLRRITDEDCKWTEALDAAVKRHADVILVDSVDEWGEGGGDVLKDIRRNGPVAKRALVIAIAHFAREGHLFGSVKRDHRANAIVIVEPERIYQNKCTWAPRAEIER